MLPPTSPTVTEIWAFNGAQPVFQDRWMGLGLHTIVGGEKVTHTTPICKRFGVSDAVTISETCILRFCIEIKIER